MDLDAEMTKKREAESSSAQAVKPAKEVVSPDAKKAVPGRAKAPVKPSTTRKRVVKKDQD
jgi:hypothetical protein